MIFFYKALTPQGEEKIGYIFANDEDEALIKLAEANLSVLEIKKEKDFFSSKPSQNDLVLFLKNLALLLKLKIDVKKALEILKESISNKKLLLAIEEIKEDLTSGKKLSECFKKHEKIFGKELPILIEIGEETALLGEILENYAKLLEENQKIASKVKSALAYPLFTLISALGILYVLMTYVVPQITKVFKSAKASLPLPTKILLSFSNFLTSHGKVLILLFIFIILFLYLLKRKYPEKMDKLLLKIPIFGSLIFYAENYKFFSYLALMISCKINFKNAISQALELCKNVYIKNKLERVKEKVLKGLSFSKALKEEGFEKLIYSLVMVGEESASLDKTLSSLANYYKTKLEEKIDFLLKILEPAITLILGLIVGFIVMSIMLPLLEMSSLIK